MGDTHKGKVLYMSEYRTGRDASSLHPSAPHTSRITDIGEYKRLNEAVINQDVIEAMELFLNLALNEVKVNQSNKNKLRNVIEGLKTPFLINKLNTSTRLDWVAEPLYWSLVMAELRKRKIIT